MNKYWKLIIILAMAGCLAGCNAKNQNPRPENLLKAKQMEEVIRDIQQLEGRLHTENTNLKNDDSLSRLVQYNYNLLMEKHGITKKDFEENLTYYLYHVDDLMGMYKRVEHEFHVLDSLEQAQENNN